jgi:hypothetical protein
MENLAGIYPAFGAFSNDSDIDVLCELLERIGASFSDDLTADNTHLVCTLPKVYIFLMIHVFHLFRVLNMKRPLN